MFRLVLICSFKTPFNKLKQKGEDYKQDCFFEAGRCMFGFRTTKRLIPECGSENMKLRSIYQGGAGGWSPGELTIVSFILNPDVLISVEEYDMRER